MKINKAIELEPNLAEAYAALGHCNQIKGNWVEAEMAFGKALQLTNEPSSLVMNNYILLNRSVGQLKKVRNLLEEVLKKDPLSLEIRTNYIAILGMQGEIQRAEEDHEHCKVLFGDSKWNKDASWAITWIRLSSDKVLSRDRALYSDLISDAAKEHLDDPKKGLEELRRIYNNNKNLTNGNLADISLWAAYFGEPGLAMDAMERASTISAIRVWHSWFPVMKEVRQTPRFKNFVKEIGLVDYWNEFGWPDICHKLDNGDFVCD